MSIVPYSIYLYIHLFKLHSFNSFLYSTYVSVQGKQRFLGDAAAAMARSNIKFTFSLMKLIVGRRFDDPEVQKELKNVPYECTKLPDGGIGVNFMYNGEIQVVPVEHIMAMMLVRAKHIACKANNNVNMADAVLAVPNHYTEAQRRGILNACDISDVNCLKLINEATAIALSYGIFKSAKKQFSENAPAHYMFIDVGYTCYTVTIVDFIQENMTVLSTVCDRNLGGRDFDAVIIEYMAEQFESKTKINVRNNKKALLKMEVAAEKAKKTLSPAGVNEASISVECLAEDRDLNCMLTRDEFEKRSQHLVARLEGTITQALSEAKLSKEQIVEVEIVGGTTRVNMVKRKLGQILGLDPNALNYGLKTTMNSDEAVARGNALQCAMSSSRMRVKDFNVTDTLYYGILAHFDAASGAADDSESKDDVSMKGTSAAIYHRGDSYPHKPRRLTFKKKSSDFTITLTYDEASKAMLPEGEDRFLASFLVKVPPESVANGPLDVRVTFNLDRNGLVYVQSAQMLEEFQVTEEVQPPTADASNPAPTDPATTATPPTPAEDKKTETVTKTKLRKIDLTVVTTSYGLTVDQLKACKDNEGKMQAEDRLIIETSDRRNELESYIYAMRDKIDGTLAKYFKSDEASKLKDLMNQAEEWLYGDGFDSTKEEYIAQLDKLKAISNPVEYRLSEESARPAAINSLKTQIDMCRQFAQNYDDAHSHITEEERDAIRSETKTIEVWMFDSLNKQGELAQNADPVLTTELITKKRNGLFAATNPIMTRKKPAPVPEKPKETKEPAQPTPSESKSDAGDGKSTTDDKGSKDDETKMDQS